MIELKEKEKIIIALHRHWILLIGEVVVISILLFTPVIGSFLIIDFIEEKFNEFYYLFWFFFSLYLLLIYITFFIIWMDHYLDMWVVTDSRIIDIEHSGIFKREVSEFSLKNVQDVTIEIPGMIPSLLKYGNVIVQTAGEKSFKVMQIPHPERVKDIIIKYSHLSQN